VNDRTLLEEEGCWREDLCLDYRDVVCAMAMADLLLGRMEAQVFPVRSLEARQPVSVRFFLRKIKINKEGTRLPCRKVMSFARPGGDAPDSFGDDSRRAVELSDSNRECVFGERLEWPAPRTRDQCLLTLEKV